MGESNNVSSNANVNAAQNHANSVLPEGFDAKTLKDFFNGLLENAKPGDRDALQALLKDLDKMATISTQDDKGGFFGKFADKYRDNINDNLVPFLEALANNPGVFGKNVPSNLNLDDTMDFIVNNAPPHLQPLLKDMANDIQDFTKSNSDQGHEIASLMGYLVNKGNTMADANPPGSAIGDMGGESPNGVGPENIVGSEKHKNADAAATISKSSEALRLVSEMIADPSKLTSENIKELASVVSDIISDIAAAGGNTKQAEMIAKEIAGMSAGNDAGAAGVQNSLITLLNSLTQQLLDDQKRQAGKSGGGGKAPKGAAGAAASGGAEAAGGGEAGGEVTGSEASGGAEGSSLSDSGGLSIFEVIAKALGDKMTAKLKEMRGFANEISSLSNAGGEGNSEKIAGLSAQLGAASQEFSLISNSFSTTIKALGEGTKAAVRYS